MGWMDSVKSFLSRKDSATGPLVAINRVGQAVWSSRNYQSFADEGYIKNVITHRCIRMIAENVAAVMKNPLIYEGDNELEQHPLLPILSRPNPWQSGVELFDELVSYFKIAGNGFVEAVILDGQLRELYSLRPDRMRAIAGRRGYPAAWKYTVSSGSVTFDMDLVAGGQLPIMHLKSFHPLDDWGGLSPVEPAAFSIDVHNSAGSFNKALLDNAASPSGALVYKGDPDGDGNMPENQFRRLKQELTEKYQGAINAGRPLLLEGGLEWVQMGMNLKELEFSAGKREAAREIALGFGVPPMLLGIPGDNTYSNYQEARLALYEETVLPLADRICEAMAAWLEPTLGPFELTYNEEKISALITRREADWNRVQGAEFLTTDEKREATGYAPYAPSGEPGGSILVPGTMLPVDEAGFTPGGAEPEPSDGAD